MEPAYFSYWGKADASRIQGDRYHLLPFHSLDVAACGKALMALPQFSVDSLAAELGWPQHLVQSLFVFFLTLHDIGKFSRAFQGLAPNLSPDLVPADDSKRYTKRHDTLGWMFWREDFSANDMVGVLPEMDDDFWRVWMRCASGHHGKPPQESENGVIQFDVREFFFKEDLRAARAFIADAAAELLPDSIPVPQGEQVAILKRHCWWLAGMAVLADWLGSNQASFTYRSQPMPLKDYWPLAQKQAGQAIAEAGLRPQALRDWPEPLKLFDYLREPTPLQRYAATVELEEGPQLFLLEDVTGAGKTEAALILAQRLMQAGRAQGLYFALPSMATANQMYQRVGSVYRNLYSPEANPSLILSHGARQLVEGFRQSLLQSKEQMNDSQYRGRGVCHDPGAFPAGAGMNRCRRRW